MLSSKSPILLCDLIEKVHTHRCKRQGKFLGRVIRAAAIKAQKNPVPIPIDVPGYPRRLWSPDLRSSPSVGSKNPTPDHIIKAAERQLQTVHQTVERAAGGKVNGLMRFRVENGEVVFDLSALDDLRNFPIREQIPSALDELQHEDPERSVSPTLWEFVCTEVIKRMTIPCDQRRLTQFGETMAQKWVPSSDGLPAELAKLDREGFGIELLREIWKLFGKDAAQAGLPKLAENDAGSEPAATGGAAGKPLNAGEIPPGEKPRPKHRKVSRDVEQRGKAAKLTELIMEEEAQNTGAGITRLVNLAGTNFTTFTNSQHFEEPRHAWKRLDEARKVEAARQIEAMGLRERSGHPEGDGEL